MTLTRILSVVLVTAMLSSIPVSMAQAATGTGTPGSGTLLSISFKTDPVSSITTVLVTLLDDAGQVQKARLSLETAIKMELVISNASMITKTVEILDPTDPIIVLTSGIVNSLAFVTDPLTGVTSLSVTLTDASNIEQVVSLDMARALLLNLISTNTAMISTSIVIDPLLIIESTTYAKVISKLGGFFGTAPGLTYDQLSSDKEAGFGYGVLAQACWMATQLGGDATLVDQILAAKSTGDFSTIILPDGTTAANWGQFRKAVLTDPHQNLGKIMSGKADPLSPSTTNKHSFPNRGHGKGHGTGGED
jgi:hypothetical protein